MMGERDFDAAAEIQIPPALLGRLDALDARKSRRL
jgi:hypothetical protein